jgi:HEXXH motif-containing protein
LITTHSLSADAFTELADGAGDSVVVRQLREAQLSKHLMLLRVVAEAADRIDPPSQMTLAFGAGYQLLAEAQAADPGAVARLLCLPHVGSWAHDCLACLDTGTSPDFGYLAAVAAAAAVRLGIRFELDVPARDGGVLLPGLGSLQVAVGLDEWVRLSSDGERLRVGEHIDVPCAALVPDDGSGSMVPHWRGTPLVRAEADGQVWEVLIEPADRYLDRFALRMLTVISEAEVTSWRQRIQAAWELLVRHHEWAAGPIAEGVPVIVPLLRRSDHDSATSPAAFGAIATSLPPSPVSMAETLVHEFQHIKLCGLLDMLPLIEPSDERGYAPWRDDPRPLGGILQGIYAFTGIVRFWDIQRRVETGQDAILRASVLYERWRLAIELPVGFLLNKGSLTANGVRFVTVLSKRGERREADPVPAEAAEIAREVALDHWLTWQLMHVAFDAAGVARLAAAYQRGEPLGGQALPGARIEGDVRKVDSILRSRLLNMRFQEPGRYQQLSPTDFPELGAADALLISGDAGAAVATYRAGLADEPDPAAWIGLALAIHRLPPPPSPSVFAAHMALLFEMHACLASRGVQADPLELAVWFA